MALLAPRVAAFKAACRLSRAGGRVTLDLGADGVATLTLRNAARRNAVSPPMMADLHEAVCTLRAWDGAAVVVAGEAPGGFCAGADLRAAAAGGLGAPEAGALMAELVSSTLDAFRDLPLLTVAAVDGHAVGGGAELATAADWRCVAADASIRFVHAHMGVSPGWGGAARLAALVGRAEALRLLLHAPDVGPDAARALGLADAVARAGEPAAAAARRLLVDPALATAAAPAALRACKAAVAASTGVDDVAAAKETAAFAAVWGAAANRAAVAAGPGGAR